MSDCVVVYCVDIVDGLGFGETVEMLRGCRTGCLFLEGGQKWRELKTLFNVEERLILNRLLRSRLCNDSTGTEAGTRSRSGVDQCNGDDIYYVVRQGRG